MEDNGIIQVSFQRYVLVFRMTLEHNPFLFSSFLPLLLLQIYTKSRRRGIRQRELPLSSAAQLHRMLTTGSPSEYAAIFYNYYSWKTDEIINFLPI